MSWTLKLLWEHRINAEDASDFVSIRSLLKDREFLRRFVFSETEAEGSSSGDWMSSLQVATPFYLTPSEAVSMPMPSQLQYSAVAVVPSDSLSAALATEAMSFLHPSPDRNRVLVLAASSHTLQQMQYTLGQVAALPNTRCVAVVTSGESMNLPVPSVALDSVLGMLSAVSPPVLPQQERTTSGVFPDFKIPAMRTDSLYHMEATSHPLGSLFSSSSVGSSKGESAHFPLPRKAAMETASTGTKTPRDNATAAPASTFTASMLGLDDDQEDTLTDALVRRLRQCSSGELAAVRTTMLLADALERVSGKPARVADVIRVSKRMPPTVQLQEDEVLRAVRSLASMRVIERETPQQMKYAAVFTPMRRLALYLRISLLMSPAMNSTVLDRLHVTTQKLALQALLVAMTRNGARIDDAASGDIKNAVPQTRIGSIVGNWLRNNTECYRAHVKCKHVLDLARRIGLVRDQAANPVSTTAQSGDACMVFDAAAQLVARFFRLEDGL
ncbi:MAG: hypothetical protein MHM6MM_001567 [Cercozoa sp. M6MM]